MGIFSSHVAKSVNMQKAKLFMSRLNSLLSDGTSNGHLA